MSLKHNEILDDYFDKGLSLEMLEATHGRSKQQMTRLIRTAESEGRLRLVKPADRRGVVGAEALSPQHRQLGVKLISWRSENELNTGAAASQLGLSKNRYAALEAGIHHITLLEMVILFKKLGWSLAATFRCLDQAVIPIRKTA